MKRRYNSEVTTSQWSSLRESRKEEVKTTEQVKEREDPAECAGKTESEEGSRIPSDLDGSHNHDWETDIEPHSTWRDGRRRPSNEELNQSVFAAVEEEIENQLGLKAEKSNLTVANVKNIIKSVIMNEDVMEMIHKSLQGKEFELQYEPKLTRSKTRELRRRQQPLSSVWALPLTDMSPKPTGSECQVLINDDLSEDSSDEEYHPGPEDDQSEDDEGNTSKHHPEEKEKKESRQSGKGKEEESSLSVDCFLSPDAPSTSLECNSRPITGQTEEERIGHRTRSKLCLSETPLEAIEQAFIPPDITCDMYDWNCDNEDWKNFLKEFMQPLDALPDLNDTIDDVEADPEYNVLADELDVVDKEELRMDRAVKVSRKELNDLMKELFEYNELVMSNREADKDSRERDREKDKGLKKEKLVQQEKSEPERSKGGRARAVADNEMTMDQRLLLDQQLRQHIQLTTQHYLQTYRHPVLHYLAPQLKEDLISLHFNGLQKVNSAFHASNLMAALNLIDKWERIMAGEEGKAILKFVEREIEKSDRLLEQQIRVLRVCKFPPWLMQVMSESDAFPYPLLLPPLPFYVYHLPEEFLTSEDQLIAMGLGQFMPFIKGNRKMLKLPSALVIATELISKHMLPIHNPRRLLRHIKTRRRSKYPNSIKEYFSSNRTPSVIHYIIPITERTLLKDHPKQLLPHVWNDFHTNTKVK